MAVHKQYVAITEETHEKTAWMMMRLSDAVQAMARRSIVVEATSYTGYAKHKFMEATSYCQCETDASV